MFNTKTRNPKKLYWVSIAEGRPLRQSCRWHGAPSETLNRYFWLAPTLDFNNIIINTLIIQQIPFVHKENRYASSKAASSRSRSYRGRESTQAQMMTGRTYRYSPSSSKLGWPVSKPSRELNHVAMKYPKNNLINTAQKNNKNKTWVLLGHWQITGEKKKNIGHVSNFDWNILMRWWWRWWWWQKIRYVVNKYSMLDNLVYIHIHILNLVWATYFDE